MIALTSLMIFALAAASNFSSLTVKIVFSFGFSTSSTGAAAAPPAAGAAAALGMATSVMLSFVFNAETNSETSRRERVEICSTRGAIFGDRGAEDEEAEDDSASAQRRGEVEKDRKRGVGCILRVMSDYPGIVARVQTYLETEHDRSATRKSVLVDR